MKLIHLFLVGLMAIGVQMTTLPALAQDKGDQQQTKSGDPRGGHEVEVNQEKIDAILALAHWIIATQHDKVFDHPGPDDKRKGRLVCPPNLCGTYPPPVGDCPELESDCADLKKKLDEAAKAEGEAGATYTMLQALLDAYNELGWWGGVGGMVADMATAATTILTAGTGTPAVNAAARILRDIGADLTTGIILDQISEITGIDVSSEAALNAVVEDAWQDLKEAQKAFREAKENYENCLKEQEEYEKCKKSQEETQAAIDAWLECIANWELSCEWVWE